MIQRFKMDTSRKSQNPGDRMTESHGSENQTAGLPEEMEKLI